MSSIDIIIPVAGKGTRLRPHTNYHQKCLLPVAEQPILGHILSRLNVLNVNKIKLITGYFEDQVFEYVKNNQQYDFKLIRQEQQLGLAHAIKLGLDRTDRPVLIVLGDSIFDMDYKLFCKNKTSNIGVLEVEDPERYGIIETHNKKITKFIEKPKMPKSNLAQIGVYFIHSQRILLDSIVNIMKNKIMKNNEYQLPDAFQYMLENGYDFDFTKIENYMDCGIVETIMNSNKNILKRDQLNYISKESNVINSKLKYCSISDGCVIENSILNNVIVLANTVIKNRQLSNVIIGSYSDELKEKDAYIEERNVY